MVCKKCSAKVDDNLNFCPKCGAGVDREVAAVHTAAAYNSETALDTALAEAVTETAAGEQPAMTEAERLASSKTYDPPENEEVAAAPEPAKKGRAKRRKIDVDPGSQPAQAAHKKTFFKFFPWILSAALLIALAGVVLFPKLFPSTSVKAYSSPEKAIEATITYISGYNVEAALNTMWGYNEKATAKFDFNESVNFYEIFSSALPSQYQPYGELNEQLFRYEAAANVRNFYLCASDAVLSGDLGLLSYSWIGKGYSFSTADEFVAAVNPGLARDIKIEEVNLINPTMQNSDSVQDVFNNKIKVYGFSELREYAVLLKINGETYMCGITAVKTDKGWQVYSFSSGLASTSFYNCLIPMSADDYALLVKGQLS